MLPRFLPRRDLRLAALTLACMGTLGAPSVANEGQEPAVAAPAPSRGLEPTPEEAARDVAMARRVAPSVLQIEWRGSATSPPSRRNAVAVDPDGFLLMAGPRPDPKGTIRATLPGGDSMPARVVAADAESALVLLSVPVGRLPVLSFAPSSRTSDRLPVGARVVMVTGTGAVARGWIRANDRRGEMPRPGGMLPARLTCLDEAALPVVAEDLGSPWLDAEGRVVGLLVGAVGAVGASGDAAKPEALARIEPVAAQAVPGRVAAVVWPLLRHHGMVERARVGILSATPSDALRAQFCPSCGGILVKEVEPAGPAESAGVLANDLIVAIGGRPLRLEETLADALLPYRPGSEVTLALLRKGQRIEAPVVLGARDD